MIKRNQKWIALLVVCTFAWLMQVAVLPAAEQGPGIYEIAKSKPAPAPKKSILPYILIGVGAVAIAAVLILVVFKTDYDITGEWHIILTGTGGGAPNKDYDPVVFTGDKKSGTYQVEDFYDGMGSYTVDGKSVTLRSTHANYPNWVWNGEFTDKTHISGTSTFQSFTWTWTATKNEAAATSSPRLTASQDLKPVLE